MLLLRSLVYNTFMVVTVVLVTVPGIMLAPFPYRVRYGFMVQWAKVNIWALSAICNLKYEVQGRENIPDGAAIIFAKHQSAWETIALQCIFPPQVWVLKRELIWVPLFGWALYLLESIAIDRSSGRKAVRQIIEKGTQRLKRGRWIVVFPEGTRVAPGVEKKYGVGGAILAEKSGFPVVPVAHNAGDYWRRRSMVKRPGTIKVVIGPMIDSKDKSAEEINAIAKEWIDAKVREISIQS